MFGGDVCEEKENIAIKETIPGVSFLFSPNEDIPSIACFI
jgi:hypothetical protein